MFTESFWNSVLLASFAGALSGLVAWILALRSSAVQKARDLQESTERTAAAIAKSHMELVSEVGALREKLQVVTAQVVPFNTAFQQILIAQLTHSHTPELDALMKKIGPPNTLTKEEEMRMHKLLHDRQHDLNGEISQEEREAALILPYVMRRAREEQAQMNRGEETHLRTVSVVDIKTDTDAE